MKSGNPGKPTMRGSVLSEYLVVMAGLLLVYTGMDIVLDFIREHFANYTAALALPL